VTMGPTTSARDHRNVRKATTITRFALIAGIQRLVRPSRRTRRRASPLRQNRPRTVDSASLRFRRVRARRHQRRRRGDPDVPRLHLHRRPRTPPGSPANRLLVRRAKARLTDRCWATCQKILNVHVTPVLFRFSNTSNVGANANESNRMAPRRLARADALLIQFGQDLAISWSSCAPAALSAFGLRHLF